MSNLGRLKRDGIFSNLQIKGKKIINEKREASFRKLDVNKNSKFGKNVEIKGDLTVKGAILNGCETSCNNVETDCNEAINAKKQYFDNLESQYKNNGTVSWSVFSADQVANKEKVVELYQSDFVNGTLRVQQPCLLKLKESLQFNPNRPATWLDSGDAPTGDFNNAVKIDPNRVLDWFPDMSAPNNAQYFQPEVAFAYGLGFFAAIAIETPGVIFDLCGYTIQQHPEHALQQRFFAVIEMADQPFMPLQGPSNFGAVLKSARNTMIKNGKIGLSSHHGIHGNDCDEIMLYNVQFENFEVAAVSLNGANNLYMKNVNLIQNRRDVPVLGTYSAARFIKRFVKMVQDMSASNSNLDNAMVTLNTEMDNTFNSVIFDNGSILPVFENVEKIVDGTCYGILLNPKGVAVNAFLNDRNSPKAFETTDIHMVSCSVNNIKGNIREIIGVANPDGGMQVDTAGALLQFFNGVSNEISDKYYYSGTVLSEVQIELAKVKKTLNDSMQSTAFLGTLNIHEGIQRWQENPTDYFEFIGDGTMQLYYANTSPVIINGNSVVYDIKCNGDTMFHVNKGVIGYRMDGVSTMCMVNCSVNNVENIGGKGSELCGPYVASHPATEGTNCVGYTGSDVFGAIFNAVNDVNICNLSISNIDSTNGCAHGTIVQNGSISSNFNKLSISNVTSDGVFTPSESYLPNMPATAVGLGVKFGCQNVCFNNTNISNVSDNTPFQHDLDVRDSVITYN